MNHFIKRANPLFKILINPSKKFTNIYLFNYVKLSPSFSNKFRLVKQSSHSVELNKSENIEQNEGITKGNLKVKLDLNNIKYPLLITSPLLTGISMLILHGVFVGSEIPELSKFIFKSTFLYGSVFAGLNIGIKIQLDEKVNSANFSFMKKNFFLIIGILGISQTLGAISLPLPAFICLYTGLYGMISEVMKDIHEEVDEIIYKSKLILMLVGFLNLLFICFNYADFKESLKDSENFDKLVADFLSTNDEKFEGEVIENDKCIRAVDYRIFKANNTDI